MAMSKNSILAVLASAWPVHAFHSFQPNCSIPNNHANYVSNPQVRGTFTIIWSCVAVLIICTWTVQHLAVPEHTPPKSLSWNHAFRRKSSYNVHKLKWMGITLMAPEFIFGKALAEKFAAHHSKKQMDKKEWTTTHGYFANMRGFVLRFNIAAVPTEVLTSRGTALGRSVTTPREDGEPTYYEQDVQRSIIIEMEHCRQICKGSNENHVDDDDDYIVEHRPHFDSIDKDLSNIEPQGDQPQSTPNHKISREKRTLTNMEKFLCQKTSHMRKLPRHKVWRATWPLTAEQIHYAYQQGIITTLPTTTAEELSDRSKGDGLVKALAILQILWLCVQIIARSFQNLAITLIEITVLAFALCAIIIYIVLWHKPQEVKVPTYIDIPDTLTREQIIALAARSPLSSLIVHEFWLHGVAIRTISDNIFPNSPGYKVRPPFGLSLWEPFYINAGLLGISIGGLLFGAVHFAAWQFDFPTPVERMLWRISCVLVSALPSMGVLAYWATQLVSIREHTIDGKIGRSLKPLWYSIVPVYLAARLYLLAEVIRSLAYLPPSAFRQVNWPSVIPHVS